MQPLSAHPLTAQSGVSNRLARTTADALDAAYLLKAGDFTAEGAFAKTDTPDYVALSDGDQHRLNSRDLLFQTRGATFTAYLPPPDADEVQYVASTVFIVLKVDIGAPAGYNRYLLGALNSPGVQTQLSRLAKGTTLPMISRRDILAVEIPIPGAEFVTRYARAVDYFFQNVQLRQRITANERTALSSALAGA